MRRIFGWGIFLCSLTTYADPNPALTFVENKNQWRSDIQFSTTLGNGHLNFFRDKLQFSFYDAPKTASDKGTDDHRPHPVYESGVSSEKITTVLSHVYNVEFIGPNPFAVILGEDQVRTRYNYFLGKDRSRWASDVAGYGRIRYNDLYCGIDMQYFTQNGRLKYEWIVSPYTDPSVIALKYNGIESIERENGNLHIRTSVNDVWEMKPLAYQWIDGRKVIIPCEYTVKDNEVRYDLPEGYDKRYTLVIDPIMIFSAYSGSTRDNWGNTATYDEHGNVYSGGMVSGFGDLNGFPVTPGAYQVAHGGGDWDVGILKYDSSGSTLLYCTYFGGNDTETPQSLFVNNAGELLILGATGSDDLPVTNGSVFSGGVAIDPLEGVLYSGGTDIFIAKLSEDGTQLTGATYLGGTKNDGVNFISGKMNYTTMVQSPLACNYGDQLRGDIITDANDFVYIASNTLSDNFPIVNTGTLYRGGSHDAIVVKLQPDLSAIAWSRYIGGADTDAAYSIKLDNSGNVFVAGGTNSVTIPDMNGYKNTNQGDIDAWVMSFTSDGMNIINGTFLGTGKYDQAYFIDMNQDDEVFVFGQTRGNYEIQGSVYTNPKSGQFIQKLSHDLTTPIFSTVVGTGGNNPNISPTAFLVSDCGTIYLSGWGGVTNSTRATRGTVTFDRKYVGGSTTGLPVSSDAYQPNTQGSDFYFMALSADASQFLYGTFLGGPHSYTHVDGGTSRFDKHGIVYHAVCASCGGYTDDFPAVNAPDGHRFNRSSNCNNAVFKFDLALLKARLQTNSVQLDMPGLNKVCIPDGIVFQNRSSGGELFEWDLGDGTRITRTDVDDIVHYYKNPGRYTVRLKAIDNRTCKAKDSTATTVDIYMAQSKAQEDDDLCLAARYQLKADGGAQYAWRSEDGSFQSTEQNPFVTPEDTTLYYVTITEATGCVREDTVQLNVIPYITLKLEVKQDADCFSSPVVTVTNLTDSLRADDELFFDFGDGFTSDEPEVQHQYENDGVYTIKLVGARGICVAEKTVTVTAYRLAVPNVITPGAKEGKNDVFLVRLGTTGEVIPGDYGYKVSLTVFNRWGEKVFTADDYQQDWSGEGLAGGVYFYEVTVQEYATCRSWVHIIK